MSQETKIYYVNKFIRRNETGEIDFDKSLQIVRELSVTAFFHPDHNILLDLRETTLTDELKEKLLEVIIECVKCKPVAFTNKIASVVPDEEERVFRSEVFEAGMKVHDFEYSCFTSFEDAIKWFSDPKM